jgi:integrase
MNRTILILLYGTGIRRSEASLLKVNDIASQRMVLHIRQGKVGQRIPLIEFDEGSLLLAGWHPGPRSGST